MTPKRAVAAAVTTATALALVLVGCSSDEGDGSPAGDPIEGGTFTQILNADPGNLDPQMSAGSALFDVSVFAYDTLVGVDEDGQPLSQLASEWTQEPMSATLTLNDGILCSDGTEFTAQTAADNLNWISDPANQSAFLGAFFPAGVTTVAEGNTITLTLSTPAPFLLLGLANLPMVCEAGMADRSTLAAASNGTGPYVLAEAVPNDHYTFELRDEYAWGPDSATVDEPGIPAVVNIRIVADGTTATNLMLSGEANAAQLLGPDAERALGADLFSLESSAVVGEQWYNHAEGHPTSDPAVRMALTQALDLDELAKVITTGKGGPASALATVAPRGCTFDSISSVLPSFDVDAANAALDAAGWELGADGVRVKDGTPLSIVFLYQNGLGAAGTAAAELAIEAWEQIGVQVDGREQDEPSILDAIFSTGAWDISWVPVSVNSPDQLIGFLSGITPPEGVNFSGIQNDDYEAGVAEAMQLPGAEGCPVWQEAESALIEAADLVPFAEGTVYMFGSGAEFDWTGQIAPTSIRMLG
ncbi:MAG TPA: peptide ABC transporter substrate-binding protein [Microbacterium sp.]|uniref:ABC transporter substrate-binding protein n=1 Tax=Microbacterium sp. TaxID=51671 RepID=UPI000EEBF44E|nr:peptide ABC transporter substrate-binding protein [Microbacterium sp.]